MLLRGLDITDVPMMMEWMKDLNTRKWMHDKYDFSDINGVYEYIKKCINSNEEKFFTIASDENEYVGTICLLHIDMEKLHAEIELVIHESFRRRGYAWFGLAEMIKYAFDTVGLEEVYWSVSPENKQAIRFFQKHGFNTLDYDIPPNIKERYNDSDSLIWYAVLKGDDYENNALSRKYVAGCRIININTVPTIGAGELSYVESFKDMNFTVKRIYYISKVPEGIRRGFHAHKKLKQLLFCPYGKIKLILENKSVREEITLSDPSTGIIIDKPTWREMLWIEKDSVLVVAASEYYDAEDYIRDYEKFKDFIRNYDDS